MLKSILYSISLAFVLFVGNTARAEEGKSDLEVTASVKAWVNEWKRVDPAVGRSVSDDIVVLAGPAVEVELKNHLVLEGSYQVSTSDYTFMDASGKTEFSRADLELALGKLFKYNIGFFFGYRNSSFKEKGTGVKEFSYGNFYSLRASYPMPGNWAFFGSLTRLNTRFKAEGVAREESPGWVTEIGGKNILTEHLALKIGYKWEVAKGKTSGIEDSFRGTTFELDYTF